MEPLSRRFRSLGLDLHYADWGNSGAPTLILLHGGRDHGRNWDWTARALRDRFHIVVPDLRGHGDSGWSSDGDYGLWPMVADLAMLVRHLGGGPVGIVGHSLGGNIAIRYAALHPEMVTRLVAIEGLGPAPHLIAARDALDPAERLREWIEASARVATIPARRYATIAEAEARMRAANPHLDPERIAHLTRHGVRRETDGGFVWKFDPMVRIERPIDLPAVRLHALWGRITAPTLLVYGRESWASDPAEDGRMAYFGSARRAMIEGAGHWVHHDRFDVFIAQLRDFLDE